MWSLLLACAAPPAWAPDGLPAHAPAATLLANLESDDSVKVHGASLAELWADVDGADDDRYAFRYVLEDEAGSPLYARSTPGPLIVREFLDYYRDAAGFDMLDVLPQLGDFPITVPLLDGATTVRLQIRDDDGVYEDQGSYDLADLSADDQGPMDAVVGGETLHDAGPSENRLDIVILGDGYTEAELGQFAEDAATLADRILAVEPLASLADRVNIHRVDAVSAESGVSYDCVGGCGFRDTAFQSIFPLEIANGAMGTDYRTTAVFQLDQWGVARAAATFPWDMVVVIANTEHDGGFAVHYATVPKGLDPTWPATGVHELAHVLGLLGDEYQADACVRSDALGLPDNITDDASAPPWADWIEGETPLPTPVGEDWDEAVGAFEGAWNCDDLYRPARTCLMRDSDGDTFCPVCGELVARRVFRFGDAADDVTVAGDTFTVVGRVEGAHVTWRVDGAVVAEDVDSLVVEEGGLVEVEVAAEMDAVRADEGDLAQTWAFRR